MEDEAVPGAGAGVPGAVPGATPSEVVPCDVVPGDENVGAASPAVPSGVMAGVEAVPALIALRSALAAGRSAVAGLGLWSVATGDLRAVLGELEALVRVAQAAQVVVLGEVASRGEAVVPGGLTPGERVVLARSRAGDGRGELAGVLGVHPATAARRQATVAFVTGSGLPVQRVARTGGRGAGLGEGSATGAALAAGRVSVEAADVVAATVLDLPEHYGPAGRAAVERVLLEHAPEVPLTVLRHHAAGLLARAELSEAGEDALAGGEAALEGADLLGRREERAHRRRELFCSPDLHGTWHVRGRLAPEAGATLMTALEALAAPEPSGERGPDLRSAAQRRADALVALADKALSAPPGSPAGVPSAGGARARVVVTMDLASLTGEVAGAGLLVDDAPLSAGAVRRLACDAEVVPVVLGSRSEPLDVGRAAYTVTPAQRRALAIRDRGCIAPGCGAPVSRTHAHHVVHWADGGPSDLSNLALVCGHDHRRVHTGALVAHVVDGRPVITRAGDPPPTAAPPPWRARLEDLAHELTDELHHPDGACAADESEPGPSVEPGPAVEPGRACEPRPSVEPEGAGPGRRPSRDGGLVDDGSWSGDGGDDP
ncbi:HNH endonuclease signature motif containing protein [uncultured Pseudokineococcus sp.]|uniref:HNH endonuclease signature motif containing protein n=1 Tax=uncultured Pseudokineococcus sp. TaxID=1642928 RepID=UPI002621B6AE|nr:HNH endonuclease signature motif containing protein [uncultured Pseudokineococcus sp.]